MLEISNTRVYDLEESVIASRNAMRLNPAAYTSEEFKKSFDRASQLAMLGGGSGHSNFRKGIRVSFDIKYPNYFSPEMQRYGFIDIVCSSSTMHRLFRMDMDACFNEWVGDREKSNMKEYVAAYNEDKSEANFMRMISNCPRGIELFMRCSTNYEQLATIYKQRRTHKLPEWHVFLDWIVGLPYSKELILCGLKLRDKDKTE